mgnify:CR=1 FL=1
MTIGVKHIVQIVGDESNMLVSVTNLTGVDEVLFESGSFKGSVEEVRLVNVVLSVGVKVFNLRLKWTDQMFNRTTITGSIRPRGAV